MPRNPATGSSRRPSGRRLFFALDFDAGFKSAVHSTARSLPVIAGRLMPPENYHMTLRFLGQVAEHRVDQIVEAVTVPDIRPFSLHFGHIGIFGKHKVLFLEPDSVPEALTGLVASLNRDLRPLHQIVKPAARAFRPHITLYRDCEFIDAMESGLDLEVPVRNFYLMESRPIKSGVYYTPVADWPLAKPSLKAQILGQHRA